MAYINLTPHSIQVYGEMAFAGLKQINPTTWVADSVQDRDHLKAVFPSMGIARISTMTIECGQIDEIPVVRTEYGDATGIPEEIDPNDILIVSLPMQSMARASGHPLSAQMVAPYKVVRQSDNGSVILGCMGFTF